MALKAILFIVVAIYFWYKSFENPNYGLSFFCIIFFIRPETIAYGQLHFLHIPLVTAIICVISYLINKQKYPNLIKPNLMISFVIFCILILFSTQFSKVFPVWHWTFVYIKIMVFCYMITRIIVDVKSFDWLILAVLLGGAFLSAWGVDQHFRGNYRLEGVGGTRFGSNEFGSILVSLFPLFLFKAFGKIMIYEDFWKRRLEIMFFAIATIFVLLTIIYTSSRGAFIGLCVCTVFFIIGAKKKIRALIIACIIVPIVFSFLPAEYKLRITTIFNPNIINELSEGDGDENVDGAIASRIDFWKAAISMIKDYPVLGIGPQNFELMVSQYTGGLYGKKDCHNTYLKIAAENGIVSLLLFLLMIILSFKYLITGIRYAKYSNNDKMYYYQYAILAGLSGFLASAFTGSYNYCETFYWLMFMTPSTRIISRKAYVKYTTNLKND